MTTNENLRFDNLAEGGEKQTILLLVSTMRGLVSLISITDRKANILLSVNAIIISVILAVSGAKLSLLHSLEESFIDMIPIILLLLTCLVSGFLAVNVVKPKQVQKQVDEHLGIFMLVRKYRDVNNYLDQIATILKSNELIYQNISTDLHSISSHLLYKNKLLRYSYSAFYTGILLSVFIYLLIWLISF